MLKIIKVISVKYISNSNSLEFALFSSGCTVGRHFQATYYFFFILVFQFTTIWIFSEGSNVVFPLVPIPSKDFYFLSEFSTVCHFSKSKPALIVTMSATSSTVLEGYLGYNAFQSTRGMFALLILNLFRCSFMSIIVFLILIIRPKVSASLTLSLVGFSSIEWKMFHTRQMTSV